MAPVIEDIKATNPTVNIAYIQCDLADNSSVRQAAAHINSLVDKVHILVNNAGIMAARNFQKSADGVEIQLAACHLGHFLLTNLIMDKLVAAQRVVINMTSSAYTLDAVDTQDPNFNVGTGCRPSSQASSSAEIFYRMEKTTIRGMRMVEPRPPTSYSALLWQTDMAARAWPALQLILEVG